MKRVVIGSLQEIPVNRIVGKKFNSIMIDEDFQRRNRWIVEKNKQMRYLHNVINIGVDTMPFLVCNIEKSLDRPDIEPSMKAKFEGFEKKNKRFVSLDGGNRGRLFKSLFDDEFDISNQNYSKFTDPISNKDVDVINKKFSQWPEWLKIKSKSCLITFRELDASTQNQLSDIFFNQNNSTPVNKQEKRHSRNTMVSNFIDSMSANWKLKLIKLYSKKISSSLKKKVDEGKKLTRSEEQRIVKARKPYTERLDDLHLLRCFIISCARTEKDLLFDNDKHLDLFNNRNNVTTNQMTDFKNKLTMFFKGLDANITCNSNTSFLIDWFILIDYLYKSKKYSYNLDNITNLYSWFDKAERSVLKKIYSIPHTHLNYNQGRKNVIKRRNLIIEQFHLDNDHI